VFGHCVAWENVEAYEAYLIKSIYCLANDVNMSGVDQDQKCDLLQNDCHAKTPDITAVILYSIFSPIRIVGRVLL
jgi:hypothetical protein